MNKAFLKTSVWNTQPKREKYVIYFASELIDSIKQKKKFRTYRFGDTYDYFKVGDNITLKENNNEKTQIKAKITAKSEIKFSEIPLQEEGHDSYINKDHQRKVFSGYYKFLGRKIEDNDKFLVIDFQLCDR